MIIQYKLYAALAWMENNKFTDLVSIIVISTYCLVFLSEKVLEIVHLELGRTLMYPLMRSLIRLVVTIPIYHSNNFLIDF